MVSLSFTTSFLWDKKAFVPYHLITPREKGIRQISMFSNQFSL